MAEKSTTPFKGDPILKDDNLEIKVIIRQSFEKEDGILEIFKAAYKQAKGGSKIHMDFIMQWYFKGGEEEGLKEFRIIEEVVE